MDKGTWYTIRKKKFQIASSVLFLRFKTNLYLEKRLVIYIKKWLSPGGKITRDYDFVICALRFFFANLLWRACNQKAEPSLSTMGVHVSIITVKHDNSRAEPKSTCHYFIFARDFIISVWLTEVNWLSQATIFSLKIHKQVKKKEEEETSSLQNCLTKAKEDVHTPLCKAVQPMMSTASTFASFSSNNETASLCPYATASISGVLGKERNWAFIFN